MKTGNSKERKFKKKLLPKPIGLLKNSQQNDNRIKSLVSPSTNWTIEKPLIGMIRNRASITPGRRNSDTNTATTHALRIFKVIQRLSLNDYRSDILDRHQSEIGVPSDDVRHPRSRCIRYRVIEREPLIKNVKTCRRLKLALFFFFS